MKGSWAGKADRSHVGLHVFLILFTLIASCKENLVEPWAYLRDVFTRLPQGLSDEQLLELLPDRWLQAHPQGQRALWGIWAGAAR